MKADKTPMQSRTVIPNDQYTWDSCQVWDLVVPYAHMLTPEWMRRMVDYRIESFPTNPTADNRAMDPYDTVDVQLGIVGWFPSGHFAGGKSSAVGESLPASDWSAIHADYYAWRNKTIVFIGLGNRHFRFNRQVDLSAMDNLALREARIIEELDKPQFPCVYSGQLDRATADELQPYLPFPINKPKKAGGGDDDDE